MLTSRFRPATTIEKRQVILISSESPVAPESKAKPSEVTLAPTPDDYSYYSRGRELFGHRRQKSSMKKRALRNERYLLRCNPGCNTILALHDRSDRWERAQPWNCRP